MAVGNVVGMAKNIWVTFVLWFGCQRVAEALQRSGSLRQPCRLHFAYCASGPGPTWLAYIYAAGTAISVLHVLGVCRVLLSTLTVTPRLLLCFVLSTPAIQAPVSGMQNATATATASLTFEAEDAR